MGEDRDGALPLDEGMGIHYACRGCSLWQPRMTVGKSLWSCHVAVEGGDGAPPLHEAL